jgi:uncharacterized 2Fe-2S/4Fe-4S cluster protein (DUF4445 family)
MTDQNSPARSQHTLILMPSGRRDQIQEGATLLEAAESMGVQIESICGGKQTCHKCHVILEEGSFEKHGINSQSTHLSPPEDQEIQALKELGLPDQRLACAARIKGDALITIPEESRGQKQIIRKSASTKKIEIKPSIRQYYIAVDPAALGEHRGDWGRVQDALNEQWKLTELEIDLHALQHLQPALEKGGRKLTATVWSETRVLDLQPGYQEGAFGLAVDVGSTTVACYLSNLRTGELLSTTSTMNPQVSFGEDLMSRVSYSMNRPDGLKKMNRAVIEAVNRLAADAARQAGIRTRQIYEITLVGNTTMIHIVQGIPPDQLGGAPFALANRDALDLKASELGVKLHPAAMAHILPSQAGHVGADNVGVLIAEQPYLEDHTILTVDVGTNAEIVLTRGDVMFSASSPTGPAFEGGQISSGMRAAPGAIERVRIDPETKQARFQVIGEERWSDTWPSGENVPLEDQPRHLAAGICGSGIIEVIAELFTAGLITGDGRFDPRVETEYLIWDEQKRKGAYLLAAPEQSSTGKPLLITQEDIRNIQLAKAALYAGAKLLMSKAGVTHLDEIILAGAFGSYIEPQHALVLGLVPDCDLEKIHAVGNAAGDGARIALLNLDRRQEAGEIAHQVTYIETAVDQDFQQEFVSAIHIPHKQDQFPHLKGILPENQTSAPRSRKRRYRRNKQS